MNAPLHVLLVEDSEDDALLLERVLREGGFDPTIELVTTAGLMRAALSNAAWDVVLADNVLPAFSAAGALELLQRTHLDIPLLVVSGHIGEAAAVALMRAGATDYVRKENLPRLIPAIAREVRDARMRADRRRAEVQVRFQAHLLNAVGQAVVATDLDGTITYWNHIAEALSGWSSAEVLGRNIRPLLGSMQSAQQAAGMLDRIRAGRSWTGEADVPHRQGGTTRTLLSNSALVDEHGRVSGIVGVFTEISELKERERHLAARIFAVVDVWDALRSDRPYRLAWPRDQVRQHIQALSGIHFDPRAVEVFLRAESEL